MQNPYEPLDVSSDVLPRRAVSLRAAGFQILAVATFATASVIVYQASQKYFWQIALSISLASCAAACIFVERSNRTKLLTMIPIFQLPFWIAMIVIISEGVLADSESKQQATAVAFCISAGFYIVLATVRSVGIAFSALAGRREPFRCTGAAKSRF